ncbi:MAG: hypothetical protein EOM08_04455 [Clostridia bacterium]|nr:hypothetical protein [Clostridia bacterium]NCC75670.1 hypothetical protein [Clostridia bacterium]
MPIRDIEALDCELAVYRKGFLSVHIDFARGYMTWRESNTWTNNFTRSLRPEQIESLRQRLMCSLDRIDLPDMALQAADSCRLLTQEQPAGSLAPTTSDDHHGKVAWSLSLKTPSGYRQGTGSGFLPEGWQELSQTIETVSRLPLSFR